MAFNDCSWMRIANREVLQPGQRKGIQNQRVNLVEGRPEEVATIRRIFVAFVINGDSEYETAEDPTAMSFLHQVLR